jgi:hypothetical protein
MNRGLNKSETTTIILVIVLAICFLKMLQLSSIPEKQQEVQIALNLILVFVTTVYVLLTNLILSDSKKSRDMEYRRTQLEKFYLPLYFALRSYEGLTTPIWDTIKPYTYLGEGNMPSMVETYKDFIDEECDPEEEERLFLELSTTVDKDILLLKKALQELR